MFFSGRKSLFQQGGYDRKKTQLFAKSVTKEVSAMIVSLSVDSDYYKFGITMLMLFFRAFVESNNNKLYQQLAAANPDFVDPFFTSPYSKQSIPSRISRSWLSDFSKLKTFAHKTCF